MTTERPISRHAVQRMADQVKVALVTGVEDTDIEFGGTALRLRKVADGEFLLQAPGIGDATRIYASPMQRPAGYPASLPFLPGEIVSVGDPGPALSLTWWAPEDPRSLLDQLDALCLADGWEPGGEMRLTVLGLTQRAYARGSTQRIIAAAEPTVTLSDTQVPES